MRLRELCLFGDAGAIQARDERVGGGQDRATLAATLRWISRVFFLRKPHQHKVKGIYGENTIGRRRLFLAAILDALPHERRTYLWMLLGKQDAIRIELQFEGAAAAASVLI